MLVERTIKKKPFGNLILLLCKTEATFFYCFGTNMAFLSRECNQRIVKVAHRAFSHDVTAAMLVERTITKKSFGNLTLLSCKT